jgi:hypothetical protein
VISFAHEISPLRQERLPGVEQIISYRSSMALTNDPRIGVERDAPGPTFSLKCRKAEAAQPLQREYDLTIGLPRIRRR